MTQKDPKGMLQLIQESVVRLETYLELAGLECIPSIQNELDLINRTTEHLLKYFKED